MSAVRAVWLNRIIMVLALAGIVVAGTLTYAHYANLVVPCGMNSKGCMQVATHSSSKWFGIPVALFGAAAYASLLALAAYRAFGGLVRTRRVGLLAYAISLVGAIVSVGLQVYSGTVIHAFCTWCIASAVIMVVLFFLHAFLYQALADAPDASPSEEQVAAAKRKKTDIVVLAGAGALCIVSLLITGYQTRNAGIGGPVVEVKAADVPMLLPDDAYTMGPKDAPITIVEFGDLCCGACQKSFALLKDVYKEHEGKIRIAFRHFPLYTTHQNSFLGAVFAEYAGEHNKFWDYIEKVYQNPPEMLDDKGIFENILVTLNLDVADATKQFENTDSRAFSRVYRDLQMADRLGIRVTPTFFVIAEGEKPYSTTLSDLIYRLSNNEKYRKLLGKSSAS